MISVEKRPGLSLLVTDLYQYGARQACTDSE